MAYVIKSVEEFLVHLGIGDQFWHMTSLYNKPSAVEGPCVITRFEEGNNVFGPCVFYADTDGSETFSFISDLTNEWHGAFLTKEAALEHFGERSWAYAIDPQLRRKVAEDEDAGAIFLIEMEAWQQEILKRHQKEEDF